MNHHSPSFVFGPNEKPHRSKTHAAFKGTQSVRGAAPLHVHTATRTPTLTTKPLTTSMFFAVLYRLPEECVFSK
jgi:hypothetical protein